MGELLFFFYDSFGIFFPQRSWWIILWFYQTKTEIINSYWCTYIYIYQIRVTESFVFPSFLVENVQLNWELCYLWIKFERENILFVVIRSKRDIFIKVKVTPLIRIKIFYWKIIMLDSARNYMIRPWLTFEAVES